MMMGLKGSWVLTNFLVITLVEFTGPPCAVNTHTFAHTGTGVGWGGTKMGLVKSSCWFYKAPERKKTFLVACRSADERLWNRLASFSHYHNVLFRAEIKDALIFYQNPDKLFMYYNFMSLIWINIQIFSAFIMVCQSVQSTVNLRTLNDSFQSMKIWCLVMQNMSISKCKEISDLLIFRNPVFGHRMLMLSFSSQLWFI